MHWNTMFITAVCVIFLIKLRWPKNKSLYDTLTYYTGLKVKNILTRFLPATKWKKKSQIFCN